MLKQVIISRKKWCHGDMVRSGLFISSDVVAEITDDYEPSRIPEVGTMCCLGFTCAVLGVSTEDMAGLGMPNELVGAALDAVKHSMMREIPHYDTAPTWLHQDWVNDAQQVNDAAIGLCLTLNTDLDLDGQLESEAQRERIIIGLFRLGGFEATFVE